MKPCRTLLSFDYGEKKIGVAIGQELTASARPLTTLYSARGQPDWSAISRLIDHWRANALIVGLPLKMDDSEQRISQAARRFANRLRGRYQLPVYLADERLSSRGAAAILRERQLAGTPLSREGESIDAVAAVLILDTFFGQTPAERIKLC